MDIEQLIEERKALLEEAEGILVRMDPEKRLSSTELKKLEKRHDALLEKIDSLNSQIKVRSNAAHSATRTELADLSAREARRPNNDGEARGDSPGGSWLDRRTNSSGWVDTRGQSIRVLAPKEMVSEGRSEGVTVGDTVRALITGARSDDEKRALSEGTDSAGGFTVPTPLASEFIDRLRRKSVAIQAGARTVPMDAETLSIARLETDPAVGWRAENSAIAEGDPTFGRVHLRAKSLAGIVRVSRELMEDSSNAGQMIENAIVQAMALEMDRASIFGDGSDNSPTGAINFPGISEVAMGDDGAAFANHDKLIDAIYELELANAEPASAAVMHPRSSSALAKLKDADGNPLTVPEKVKRVPMLTTTGAPIDETQGTADDASSIVFGDFSQLLIGMRETIQFKMLDQIFADRGQLAIICHARMDAQLAHAASFCRLKGIVPAT